MLDIVELIKSYDSFQALDGVSFSIDKGSFTTILGPSGSGKSTLLLTIAGFVEPTSGDIRLRGKSLLKASPEDRNFGVVFQGYALFPHLRVGENVAFPLQMRKMAKPEIEQRVRAALERVKLLDRIDHFPRQLSGGQQQRVALARALVFDPELVLLDEPLSALDKNLREALRDELRRLHSEIGMTFVLVTHDQEEALELSDTIAVINNGRLEQFATPSILYETPATRFVAGFIGRSSLIKVTTSKVVEGMAEVMAGRYVLHCPAHQALVTKQALLVLRPEQIVLAAPGAVANCNAVPATVVDRSYRGAEIVVTLTSEVGELIVRLPSGNMAAAPKAGEAVLATWDKEAGCLLPDNDG